MAGRKPASRSAAKRTSTATTAGKTAASSSSSREPQQEQQQLRRRGRTAVAAAAPNQYGAEVDGEGAEVTLLYRKPATRGTHAHSSSTAATGDAAPRVPSALSRNTAAALQTAMSHSVAAAVASPETTVLDFWRRASGTVNLSRYLAHCGVLDVQLRGPGGDVYTVTQQQIFHCSGDRLETALQALRNMEALIFAPPDTTAASGAPWVGHACWTLPQHQAAVLALAQVCEAAVPLQLPSLEQPAVVAAMTKAGDAVPTEATDKDVKNGVETTLKTAATSWSLPLAQAGGPRHSKISTLSEARSGGAIGASAASSSSPPSSEDKIHLVPSPVLLVDVHRRLRCVRRLSQLRASYTGLLPRLHAANTIADLQRSLFEHDAESCQTLHRLRQVWRASSASPGADVYNVDTFTTQRGDLTMATRGASPDVAAQLDLLSSYLGNPMRLDTVLPFVGITARHPQEEALLQHLVSLLKETTTVDAEAWGPMAGMATWKCTDGLYVVQHACRVRALRRLIAEAQFYGLPRFLRSIRTTASVNASAAGVDSWLSCDALQRAQARYPDQFFLTPDALDPAMFTQPDSVQVQLVQEELVTLQRTHCAVCLLVGEADEIVALLHDHLQHTSGAWKRLAQEKKEEDKKDEGGGLVKQEPVAENDENIEAGNPRRATNEGDDEEEEEGGENEEDSAYESCALGSSSHQAQKAQQRRPVHDPLQRYVLQTVEAARHREEADNTSAPGVTSSAGAALPFSHIQWMESGSSNQWSANTHYYGVVYMVVLETGEWELDEVSLVTEGLLPNTAIPILDGETAGTPLRPPRPPTYCVNAMVELWRS